MKKIICTSFFDFLNEQISQYKEGDILPWTEMSKYILNNKLRNSYGKIDYEEAKNISAASENWVLTKVSLENFDFYADSNFKNKSIGTYPIVIYDEHSKKYDVLDGRHRIGMLKDKNVESTLMWVGV